MKTLEEYLADLDAILLLESDDDVARAAKRFVDGEFKPIPEARLKAGVINSKQFTRLIERIGWILASKEEIERVFGRTCCTDEQKCLKCQTKEAIAKKEQYNGRVI